MAHVILTVQDDGCARRRDKLPGLIRRRDSLTNRSIVPFALPPATKSRGVGRCDCFIAHAAPGAEPIDFGAGWRSPLSTDPAAAAEGR